MAQLSNQSDLSTDAYSTARPIASPKTGLTPNNKKILGISAATVLLGGVIGGIVLARPTEDPEAPEVPTGPDGAPKTDGEPKAILPAEVDVAGKVTDTMSFNQAFAAARDEVGIGGAFSWHGRWYNTFEKDEWSDLSLEQRQEYAEMITGEKLPVKLYTPQTTQTGATVTEPVTDSEPTIIEGHLNGQRVMGLDFDHDGVIDTLVLDGADGNTYQIVDTRGNDGLDTIYQYDSLDGELTGEVRLQQPFLLSNDDFNQALEESMSKEVVASILESDTPTTTTLAYAEDDNIEDAEDASEAETEQDDDTFLVDRYKAEDDTYVNDGDVHDMDEH